MEWLHTHEVDRLVIFESVNTAYLDRVCIMAINSNIPWKQ